jgi:hypothetical protein
MKFDPELHTVSYLIKNEHVILKLCQDCQEFGLSDVAGDKTLLSHVIQSVDASEYGFEFNTASEFLTVAHLMAEHQRSWIDNPACEDKEILGLRDDNDYTVAHELATSRPLWFKNAAAKDLEVLSWTDSLKDESVGYLLAEHNSQWVNSLTISDMDIMLLPIESKNQEAQGSTIAGHLASKSPSEIPLCFLNNVDFLCIKDTHIINMNYRLVGHILAEKSQKFIELPIAKTKDVLSLRNSKKESIAHEIAHSKFLKNWDEAGFPMSDDILLLTDENNSTVAHHLLRNISLSKEATQRFWTDSFLKMAESTDTVKNRTIAHLLASNYPDWVMNASEAYLPDFLFLAYEARNSKDGFVTKVSVAESLGGLSLSKKIMRCIQAGGAFLISGPSNKTTDFITNEQLEIEMDTAFSFGIDYLNNQINPEVKVIAAISLYTTFEQLEHSLFGRLSKSKQITYKDAKSVCSSYTARLKDLLIELIQPQMRYFERLDLTSHALNERTKDFLLQEMAKINLEGLDQVVTSAATADESKNSFAPKFY